MLRFQIYGNIFMAGECTLCIWRPVPEELVCKPSKTKFLTALCRPTLAPDLPASDTQTHTRLCMHLFLSLTKPILPSLTLSWNWIKKLPSSDGLTHQRAPPYNASCQSPWLTSSWLHHWPSNGPLGTSRWRWGGLRGRNIDRERRSNRKRGEGRDRQRHGRDSIYVRE